MQLIFANPAGWWTLLGLPALVIIHLFQRRSKQVLISTMFLFDRLEVESRAGRRIERWRNSRMFWWQVLAILLLAWLLSEPRWVVAGTRQRVAFVIDSVISMEAFRTDVQKGLARDTATLARGAAHTEWLLMESDLARPPLYQGDDRSALLAALNNWEPNLGSRDPGPALRTARAAVGNDGLLYFLTYRLPADGQLPVEAHPLAYGRPLDNVGVVGASADLHEGQLLWQALVHNFSNSPQQRNWWIETDTQRAPPQALELAPGETKTLQGVFPPGADHLTIALDADSFSLDDRAPLVLPKAKPLTIAVQGPDDFAKSLAPVLQMLTDAQPAAIGQTTDLEFSLGSMLTTPLSGSQIFFNQVMDASLPITRGVPALEPSALMDGLNWSGLLYQRPNLIAMRAKDTALLWDANEPLIFIRPEPQGAQLLVLNLDPRAPDNITRLPAFVLLVNRFVEDVRHRKPAPERANFLSGQPLNLILPSQAHNIHLVVSVPDAKGGTTKRDTILTATTAAQVQAPSPPAFFTVNVDGQLWVDGASLFPNPQASDFRDAASIPLSSADQIQREQANSHPDNLAPLWLLLLLGALLASWYEAGKT